MKDSHFFFGLAIINVIFAFIFNSGLGWYIIFQLTLANLMIGIAIFERIYELKGDL